MLLPMVRGLIRKTAGMRPRLDAFIGRMSDLSGVSVTFLVLRALRFSPGVFGLRRVDAACAKPKRLFILGTERGGSGASMRGASNVRYSLWIGFTPANIYEAAEGACKYVAAKRLKQSGMIWTRDGSAAMLALRTTWLNDEWEQLWSGKPLAA